MTILVVYSQEPPFPATDQNPDAVRYHVGIYWADCLGDEPTEAEILEFINPPAPPVKHMLGPISAATLSITGGEVLGVDTSVNFAMAFPIDIDKYWVMFTQPEPDTDYLVLGNVPFVRNADYIEITAQDPSEVSLTTWRVQES